MIETRTRIAVACGVLSIVVVVGVACGTPTLQLRELAGDGNPCVVVDDCCVVVDACAVEAFVVTADEFDDARGLVARRQDQACADCILPVVVTECVEGRCVGKAFSAADVAYAAGQPLDSCGSREVVSTAADANVDVSFADLPDGVATCGSGPI